MKCSAVGALRGLSAWCSNRGLRRSASQVDGGSKPGLPRRVYVRRAFDRLYGDAVDIAQDI